MGNQWTTTEIARMENRRYIWRDAKVLVAPLVPTWLTFAVLSAVTGMSWRTIPASTAPSIYTLLDICGIALWVAGWQVAESLSLAMRRRSLHQYHQAEGWPRLIFLAFALLGVAAALSASFSGLLLAYSSPTVLQDFSTQDTSLINLRLGGLFFSAILLGGSCCLLASCCIALLAARTGCIAGPLLWGLAAAFFNLSTIGGLADHIPRLTLFGMQAQTWVPPTIGLVARQAMARLSNPAVRYEYLKGLTDSTFGLAIVLLLCLLLITLLVSLHAPRLLVNRRIAMQLSCLLGLAVTFAYALAQQWIYITDPAVRWPGDWHIVFVVGLLTILVSQFIFNMAGLSSAPSRSTLLVWSLISGAGFIVATAPAIRAGQATHAEVLLFAALVYPFALLCLGAFQSARAQDRSTISQIIPALLIGVAILFSIPLNGNSSLLDSWTQWSSHSDHVYVGLGISALILFAALRLAFPAGPRAIRTAGIS